jgi:hypothetical protein
MSASDSIIDGTRSPLPLSLFSIITHRHNILWEKIIDIQTDLSYISPARMQCLIKGGENYHAPAQRLIDFLRDRTGTLPIQSSFSPGVRSVSLREALPGFVFEALQQGIIEFDRKMRGFITEDAILIGVETRTSSPVGIVRGSDGQSVNTAGLYPCGEGAGYAGGIIISALDGIRVAEKMAI